MPRSANVNKEKGRLSKKHGRRERLQNEESLTKPLTKTQRESKNIKKSK